MPTLLLWGERDAFMEVDMAEITRIYVKNHFRLTILSEASHWLQQDQPDIVNKLIWTFLKEETRKREWLFVHVLRGLHKSSSDLKSNCYQGHISSLPSILSSVREKCFQCTVHLDTNVTAKRRSEYENIWYQHWIYLYTCILHMKTPALRYMCLYRKKITESCLVLFSPLLYSLNVWCLLQIYNETMERCHTEGSHGLSFSICLIF